MKKLRSYCIGVDEGDMVMFSDFEDGGDMWSGEGPRQSRVEVRFSEPFLAPPVVHISMSMWDFGKGFNHRADISPENVTEHGFDAVFRTWSDTQVARIRARWMAIGELKHEDDWQLY